MAFLVCSAGCWKLGGAPTAEAGAQLLANGYLMKFSRHEQAGRQISALASRFSTSGLNPRELVTSFSENTPSAQRQRPLVSRSVSLERTVRLDPRKIT